MPAIADLAAPGRPDVDAVVAVEEVPARRRRRPSRHMRARADEMARLLARATPSSRSRRSLSSLPAAAAVMAAVAVGGVGIALGLDAQRTGVALPDVPDVPAEQTPLPETGETTDGAAGTVAASPTVNTGVVDALDPDAAGVREASPSSVAAEAPRVPAGPPRATTPTSRPRGTSPAPSTRAEPTGSSSSPTPRSTSTTGPTPRSDGTDGSAEPDESPEVGSRGPDDLGSDDTEDLPLDGGDATAD